MKKAIIINDNSVLYELMGAINCSGECVPTRAELETKGDNVKVSIYYTDSNFNTVLYYFETIERNNLPLEANKLLKGFLKENQNTLILCYI